jgi:hypothetical protein
MKILSQEEFSKKHPEAFEGLPECYQADSVLLFGEDESGLYCFPKESEIHALGDWTSMWEPKKKQWSDVE